MRDMLGATGQSESKVGAWFWGLLGNGTARKDRGRWEPIGIPGLGQKGPTLLDLVADNQLGNQATITVGLLPAAGETVIPPCVGIVEWGTDGADSQQRVEFDLQNGAVLSVAGSSIRVFAVVESAIGELSTARAGAWIGYEAKSGTGNLTRTLSTGTVADGATFTLPVPAYATAVAVLRSVIAAAFTSEWLDGAGAVLALGPDGTSGAAQNAIPNGARSLRITNSSGAALALRAVFTLGGL